ATGRPGPEEQDGSAAAEPAGAEAPAGHFEKLTLWLGKFHPAAVHFPVALLTAAAISGLLRLTTGKSTFDVVTRYWVWLGPLTALAAGALGWFLGGFRLTDSSWVMTAHRWLGTAAVAWAGLVLLLCEVSGRPDRRRARGWSRVALLGGAVLVLVTGFFGGALVFGIDHSAWPP